MPINNMFSIPLFFSEESDNPRDVSEMLSLIARKPEAATGWHLAGYPSVTFAAFVQMRGKNPSETHSH